MIKLLLLLVMGFVLLCAETEFAKPLPSMEHPRKILFTVTEGDDEAIHHVLSSANNVLKFYGPENVQMQIVAYYHGIRALLKKEKKMAERVDTLMQYDVTFVACGNTMRSKKIEKNELIEGTMIVTAGIVEIVERVKEGYTYIKP